MLLLILVITVQMDIVSVFILLKISFGIESHVGRDAEYVITSIHLVSVDVFKLQSIFWSIIFWW